MTPEVMAILEKLRHRGAAGQRIQPEGELRARRRTSGFSLIELLFVVGGTAVIFAIALPNIQTTLQAYRLQAATLQLTATLGEARSRATAENRRITVAFVRAGDVFGVDTNADGTPEENQFLPSGVNFAGDATLTFGSRGELLAPPLAGLPPGADSQIQITNGWSTRNIRVSLRGRVAVQ